MKLFSVVMGSLLLFAGGSVYAQNQPAGDLPKYGLYMHFGPATFQGYDPKEKDFGTKPASQFAPTGIDAGGWARAAKKAGMDFAILTVKHEDGFCLWPAKDYEYNIGQSPVKNDIIAEYIAACNAEGIKPGVHYSIPDAHSEGQVKFGVPLIPAYYKTVKKHITDLHTRYPGIRIQIFDAARRLSETQFAELSQIIKRLNPSCMIIGDASCRPPDTNGDKVAAFYGCGTVNKSWFWSRDAQITPAQKLYENYQRNVSKGLAFILNVGIDKAGRIPDNYLSVLMDVKSLIDHASVTPPAESAALSAELRKSLILHFDFDNAPVSGKIVDKSGHGNDGRLTNVQWTQDGHSGGAASFGLMDSYITVPNKDDLNPARLTLAVWIKTSYKDRVWRRIIDKYRVRGYDLSMCGDWGNCRGQVALESGNNWAPSGVQVADGSWHQVVGTFDGNNLMVYVDGQFSGKRAHWEGDLPRSSYDLTIGSNLADPDKASGEVGASFNGMMDDVMIFNRALSAAEIQALFKPGSAQISPANGSQNKAGQTDRLKQVKQLFDQGLITKEQYDQKIKEIIDKL